MISSVRAPSDPSFRRSTAPNVAALLLLLLLPGCKPSTSPKEIWLTGGAGLGQVVYPRGIVYDPYDDSFFVVDRMARIQHLDNKGHAFKEWRTLNWEHGKPVGLSVGPDHNLYVADTHYNRVLVYSPDGQLVRQWGKEGNGPGEFIYPTDIAWDAAGNTYVSEYGNNDRIQVFDRHGNYLRQFGKFGDGDGQFIRPQSMLINGDTIYVTDAGNHRICVFKTDGTWVRNMCHVGSGLGELRFPYGLDEDDQGHLVVCEFGNNRVQWLDKATGRGIRTWGSAGREPGNLAYPWGVAVDKQHRVVIVDAGNNRLQVTE